MLDRMYDDFSRKTSLGVSDGCVDGNGAAMKMVYAMLSGGADREKLERWKALEDRYRLGPLDFGHALKETSDSCGALFAAMYDVHKVPPETCFTPDPVPMPWDDLAKDSKDMSAADVSRRLGAIDAMTLSLDRARLEGRAHPEKLAAVEAAARRTAALFGKFGYRPDSDALAAKYRGRYLESMQDECRRRATHLAGIKAGLLRRAGDLRRVAEALATRERELARANRMAAPPPARDPGATPPPTPRPGYWRDDPKAADLARQNAAAIALVEKAAAAGTLDPAALQAARHVVNLYDGANPSDPQSWTHENRARLPLMRDELETCRRYVQLDAMLRQLARAVKAGDEKKAGVVEQYIRQNMAGYHMYVGVVDAAADRVIAAARGGGGPAPASGVVSANRDAATARLFPWRADLRGLARVPATDRLDMAEQYARDLLRACGQDDPARVKPAARWILGRFAETGDADLLVGAHGALRLGGATVSWERATPFRGAPGGAALIERGPDLRVVNEYLSDGTRLHWWMGESPVRVGGGALTNEQLVRNVYITREESSTAGGKVFWNGDNLKAVNVAQLKTELQGTSLWDTTVKQRVLDPAGRMLQKTPGLGVTVEFFNWAGETFYDGAVGGSQYAIGKAANDPFYRMEGLSGMLKEYQSFTGKDLLADFDQSLPRDRRALERRPNPLEIPVRGRPAILDFVAVLRQRDPETVKELDLLIPDIRRRLLLQMGYTPANLKKEFEELVHGPVTDEERAVALLRFVGAGSYGERIARMGEADRSFWTQAAGGGMSFLEEQGKGLPMLLALYGLGNLAQASGKLVQASAATETAAATTRTAASRVLLVAADRTVQAVNGTLSVYMNATAYAGMPDGLAEVLKATQSGDPADLTRALLKFGSDAAMLAGGPVEKARARKEAVKRLGDVREALVRGLRETPPGDVRRAEWKRSLNAVNDQLARQMPYEEYQRLTQGPGTAPRAPVPARPGPRPAAVAASVPEPAAAKMPDAPDVTAASRATPPARAVPAVLPDAYAADLDKIAARVSANEPTDLLAVHLSELKMRLDAEARSGRGGLAADAERIERLRAALEARSPREIPEELRRAHFPGGLTDAQLKAIEAAHWVGFGEPGDDGGPARVGHYTAEQLRRKVEFLRDAGFTAAQRRALIEGGVAGLPDGKAPMSGGKKTFWQKLLAQFLGPRPEAGPAIPEGARTIDQLRKEAVKAIRSGNGVVYQLGSGDGAIAVKLVESPELAASEEAVMRAIHGAFPPMKGFGVVEPVEAPLIVNSRGQPQPTLASRWVGGKTLKAFLEEGGSLTDADRRVLHAGIEELHRLGYAHADLALDNFMVAVGAGGEKTFTLLDLGSMTKSGDAAFAAAVAKDRGFLDGNFPVIKAERAASPAPAPSGTEGGSFDIMLARAESVPDFRKQDFDAEARPAIEAIARFRARHPDIRDVLELIEPQNEEALEKELEGSGVTPEELRYFTLHSARKFPTIDEATRRGLDADYTAVRKALRNTTKSPLLRMNDGQMQFWSATVDASAQLASKPWLVQALASDQALTPEQARTLVRSHARVPQTYESLVGEVKGVLALADDPGGGARHPGMNMFFHKGGLNEKSRLVFMGL